MIGVIMGSIRDFLFIWLLLKRTKVKIKYIVVVLGAKRVRNRKYWKIGRLNYAI